MRPIILSLLLLAALCPSSKADDYRFPIDTIKQTLNYIAIDTADVGFRTDWVDLDSFRLALINDLMYRPLKIPSQLKSDGDLMMDSSKTLPDKLALLKSRLGIQPDNSDTVPVNWSEKVRSHFDTFIKTRRGCDSLSNYIAETLRMLAVTPSRTSLQRLSTTEQYFLSDTFLIFLSEEEKDADRSLEGLDSIQKMHELSAIRFRDLSANLRLPMFVQASDPTVTAYQQLANWIWRNPDILTKLEKCDLISQFKNLKTLLGTVTIGGPGNDHYEGFYNLIIDLGGDDEYYLSRSEYYENQIIIDLSGNDKYFALSDHVMGAGFFSTGILDDWSGNDIYIANSFSQGCGIFGTGILIDRAGDDLYRGDIGCQAASSFGIGMLLDNKGRDTYQAALYSQGFGFIMGASALVDRSGNDTYAAGWKYGDILRYEDHYVSLSQGFGYGLRPYFSGGIGYLVDGGGNDQYSADIFGQGASYWFGFGGLIDYGGNDNYLAYQYAQGAATHMCVAGLVDISGEDLYSSKGVSQGCGHDIAFGLLLDCSGNDQYSATDLSQAAGSANGIGMLIDLRGNDGHMARVDLNTHGYGNPRREYGSIGLFLDLEGKDNYRGFGKDNSYWVTQSKWGIGADLNSEVKK